MEQVDIAFIDGAIVGGLITAVAFICYLLIWC